MPETKVLARDHQFHLNTGTEDTPVWVEIKGITSFSFSPQLNRADTTSFDEDGVMSHIPASRGLQFTLSGRVVYSDYDNAVRDPGQAACLAWGAGQNVGPAALKQFRVTYPAGETDVFYASANVTAGGGGTDDASEFSLDCERSGATTSSDLAAAPSTPGTPTGVAGDDLVTLTWTGSAGTGGYFEVVSVKTSDSTEISRLTSTSPYTFNGLATGTAYKFKVRAINADGVASDFTALSAEYTTT